MSAAPTSPVDNAEALLLEVRQIPPNENRCAWAIGNQDRLAEAIEDLLAVIRGFESENSHLSSTAGRLLDATRPLLTRRRTGQTSASIDEYIEGTAPRLRRAFTDLEELLNP